MGAGCSVVVHSLNRREFLQRALTALAPGRHDLEVIVADSGSTDGSRELVRREFPWVQLVALAEDRGLAAGRNAGIRAAGREFIVVMDEDVIVSPEQVRDLTSVMEAHPEAGVVSCCKVNQHGRPLYRHHVPGPSTLGLSFFIMLEWSIREVLRGVKAFFRVGEERPHQSVALAEIPFIGGAFALVRAEAVRQVGLLDENVFFYGEDFDWWYRFRQQGWKILYLPQFMVQAHRGTNSERSRRASLVAMQSRRYLFIKHVGRRYLPVYLLVALTGLIPRAGYYLLQQWRGRGGSSDITVGRWLWQALQIILGARSVVRLHDSYPRSEASIP